LGGSRILPIARFIAILGDCAGTATKGGGDARDKTPVGRRAVRDPIPLSPEVLALGSGSSDVTGSRRQRQRSVRRRFGHSAFPISRIQSITLAQNRGALMSVRPDRDRDY